MQINKDTEIVRLQNGNEVEVYTEFFLNQLIHAIEESEDTYSSDTHKVVVIGTLQMIFFKFQLADYMANIEVTKADYEKWFKNSAENIGADKFIYNQLFGVSNEK